MNYRNDLVHTLRVSRSCAYVKKVESMDGWCTHLQYLHYFAEAAQAIEIRLHAIPVGQVCIEKCYCYTKCIKHN